MKGHDPKTDLVVLQTHPIQYYAPLYRLLAQRARIRPHVVYLSDAGARGYHDPGFGQKIQWDIPLLDDYEWTVLEPDLEVTATSFRTRHSTRLIPILERLSPRWVLIYGYASRMNWAARRWAAKSGVKVAYSSDSNINDRRQGWKHAIKRPLLGYFFTAVDAALCTSEANEAYVRQYAARRISYRRMPFAIDVERFSQGAPKPAVQRPFDFIWAGKFSPRKRPLDFISALALAARSSTRPVKALMIGDGPMRPEVERALADLSDEIQVELMGFVNQQQMPALLQSASCLALTSDYEPYGLIATEAAAAGLGLIVTAGVGCLGEGGAAQKDRNALIYEAGDVNSLAAHMESLLGNDSLMRRMKQESVQIAGSHRFADAAEIIENVMHG